MANQASLSWKTITLFLISTSIFIILYILPLETFAPLPIVLTQFIRTFLLMFSLFLLFERLFTMEIYTKILIGLILGAVAGILFKSGIAEVKPVGTAFIRLIRMIIIPLVFASLLVGTASLGDPKKMGRIGLRTLLYYLVYTIFAIFIGLILANLLKPGSGLSADAQGQLMQNFSGELNDKLSGIGGKTSTIDLLLNIIPINIFEGLTNSILLQIIFFAIFTGIALALIPNDKAKPVLAFFEGLNEAMIKIVHIAIKLAPYGVFALIAAVAGSHGMEVMIILLKYTLVTIAGMIILNFTYPPAVKFLTGMNPITFIKGIREPQLIAFSTSSSSATLPVTIEACTEKLGVPLKIASFVLPIGATVNMNGTALYQGVSAIFIAQVTGFDLTITDQLMIVLTATLASIGAPGAPMAGIMMLVVVLEQVGIPPEGIALLLGVERILDMFRTTLNITGDASAAVVIAASEGELELPSEK